MRRRSHTTLAACLAFVTAVAWTPRTGADEPPPSEEPSAPKVVDVTVQGAKAPAGAVNIGAREIREMPGVMGDPYRAIEVQPGVTPAGSGIPFYFVRGAPPGNVGYFLDGIPVPFLFHIGAGPGVIPPGLVSNVELYLGAYPASLGRLAGAVVTAETKAPRGEWHGEGIFRTLDMGGLVEGAVGEETVALVGGHYSVGAPLLQALVPSVGLSYGDYQARVATRALDGRVTAFAFGSYDYLALNGDRATDVLLDGDFHRLDLRYDRVSAGGTALRTGITLGVDRSRGAGVRSANDYKIASRTRVSQPLGSHATLRAGVDLAFDAYDIQTGGAPCAGAGCPPGIEPATELELEEAFRVLFPSRADVAIGGWTEVELALGDRATIHPGIRLDHYTSAGATALAADPRLSGRFAVGEHLWLVPAVGVASQLPGFAPIPALQIGGIPGGLQRSLQTSFGAEWSLLPFEGRATVFRQATFGLTDAIGDGRGGGFRADRFLTRSTGDAYGLELAVRGALRRDLFAYAAYTLSRATRTRDGITRPSAYDRTHVLHLALLYDLGRGWRAGLRHVFYTGFPADEEGLGHTPSTNPARTRPFYRLDARLSKRWRTGKTGYFGLVFDFQNATLSQEVFDVVCEQGSCQPRTIGPISIPGLALEGGF